ncbi:hypothetical protein BV360_02049 [Pseudomonas syringae pv. actinidiae]|nr:hypothetical protein BV340_01851 [Pseudomonas syringae pv. actinidiae]OSN27259.1 hypothetical protein BV341_01836 [Pseudomonas syringae pv. actinidiae]OSN37791.1 hypothetical protein BV342_01973 [Pseudomonas syringae pv. actinidiae]OSN61025.1 hypothetical protein BV347_01836 [Pseudomonas syringae pv. actinidiae]OSN72649.1 hypothetical protein BV350_01817 [Pseudomonas syringae pv. actinidiae]
MTRPFFTAAWAASQNIYDPVAPEKRVAELIGGLVYRLKINFSHACVVIAARTRCILFKISSPLAFQT